MLCAAKSFVLLFFKYNQDIKSKLLYTYLIILAAIYGDPHVLTFDGKEYTVNARGEYRLLISTRHNFRLQGRFERPPNATCKF